MSPAPPLTPSSTADEISAAVMALGDPETAAGRSRWFLGVRGGARDDTRSKGKTGPGDYGEGDVFAGVRVPELRKLSRRLRGFRPETAKALLTSEIHEIRQLALFTMTLTAARAGDVERAEWVDLYRDAVRDGRVNNWDLVDLSADPLLGAWLVHRGTHAELLEWASRRDLWERRVGIIGTFAFTKAGRPEAIVDVAPLVIDDRRDLIQKAFGWMLRELGKRVDRQLLLDYLQANAGQMGRTALSYATEHLTADQRAHYRSL